MGGMTFGNHLKTCGSMSFVWSWNDHVLDYFFHRGKLWSVGHSALVPEELGTLWGAAGSLWEL